MISSGSFASSIILVSEECGCARRLTTVHAQESTTDWMPRHSYLAVWLTYTTTDRRVVAEILLFVFFQCFK